MTAQNVQIRATKMLAVSLCCFNAIGYTPGHLLRRCGSSGSCHLISYRQLCSEEMECIETSMPVSSLIHSFDWSQYQTTMTSCDSLHVTSVTQHPYATVRHPSRLVAITAEAINRYGLGYLCDTISWINQVGVKEAVSFMKRIHAPSISTV